MMKVQVLLPTAGIGERMQSPVPKPLLEICNKPLIWHTLKIFENHPLIDSVILIAHSGYKDEFKKVVASCGIQKVKQIVEGGQTRTQSVRNGLLALDKDTSIVMIHDGVRPLLSSDVIDRGLALVELEKAVVAAVPAKATLKVVSPKSHVITETLDRSLVWEIQTPQIFDRALIERAYREDREGATDDAALVERLGVNVKVFPGDYRNIKITTPEDIAIAEAFLKAA